MLSAAQVQGCYVILLCLLVRLAYTAQLQTHKRTQQTKVNGHTFKRF